MTITLGNLIFDSWRDSFPGLRGSGDRERHLIYEGDGLILDLHVKPHRSSASVDISGQAMPMDDSAENVAHLPVSLESGGQSLRTVTNALGEFGFRQVSLGRGLDVCIALGTRHLIIRGLSSHEPRKWKIVTEVNRARVAKEGLR